MNHSAIIFTKWLFLIIGTGMLIAALFGDTPAPLLFGFLSLIFVGVSVGIIGYGWWWKKKVEDLKRNGELIYADLQQVKINASIKINGTNPFRVIAQWHDIEKNRVLVFRSANLWFDPTKFLQNKRIPIYVDRSKPTRYYMDLSFLPEAETQLLG